MPDHLDATAARRQFGRVVQRVAAGERVVIDVRGRCTLAMVPVEELDLLSALDRLAARRSLHPAEQEDWTSVFPGMGELDV